MALPENFVSREDLGWGPTGADYADPDLGLVIHYDSSVLDLANKSHTECIAYWNNTRDFHMDPPRNWADVGYSFFCCPHDYILEGRGLNRYQAAQGTTAGNSNYYSATLATGPGESIPAAQINAVRRLRWWLIEDHNNHSQVLGHRDFTSTSCPGELAYDMVEDGTFAQAPGAVLEGGNAMSILGLSKGDNSDNGRARPVAALQHMLGRIGEYHEVDLLPEYGADTDYGDETSNAVLWVRVNLHNSTAQDGDTITSYAYDQIWASYILAVVGGPSSGSTSTDLPDEEDVTFKGTIYRG